MTSIGDFEQLVLLATLQLGTKARAADLRAHIARAAERSVSRGALYATLDRLESKRLLTWEVEESTPARGGIPRRRFVVTAEGLAALQRSHRAVARLSEGLDGLLERT
jgi:PadR family transcriptional regulator PadR